MTTTDRPGAVAARFVTDTAVETRGEGRFDARIDPGWWIERGPNGGYVAAVILRALTQTVAGEGVVDEGHADAERRPRSLTVHYQAPPVAGPAEVTTRVVRQGRSLTFLSAELAQDGVVLGTAQAAFARARTGGPEFCDLRPPEVPPADRCPPAPEGPIDIAIRHRYETRPAFGDAPFSGSGRSITGGWIRLAEPTPVDSVVLAAVADAWVPPVFARFTEAMAVPTIDLTVHFRAPVPADLAPDAFLLTSFATRVGTDGFVEEDGEIWTAEGVLLAQCRQLALAVPVTLPATSDRRENTP